MTATTVIDASRPRDTGNICLRTFLFTLHVSTGLPMHILKDKLDKLRERYKIANEWERKGILLAVKQLKKEHGEDEGKSLFEDTFETAKKIFT